MPPLHIASLVSFVAHVTTQLTTGCASVHFRSWFSLRSAVLTLLSRLLVYVTFRRIMCALVFFHVRRLLLDCGGLSPRAPWIRPQDALQLLPARILSVCGNICRDLHQESRLSLSLLCPSTPGHPCHQQRLCTIQRLDPLQLAGAATPQRALVSTATIPAGVVVLVTDETTSPYLMATQKGCQRRPSEQSLAH